MPDQYPIFIICRDRLSCTKQLIEWLEKVGQEEIYLVDNDSTYGPLLEYYGATSHKVLYQGANTGHTGIWYNGTIPKTAAGRRYVVSDPDVVPVESCPDNAIDYFNEILNKHEDKTKVGFSLKIDDLPQHYPHRDAVIRHESAYMAWSPPDWPYVFAPIDTTFALYRENAGPEIHWSVRTRAPFEARHLPWYIDGSNLDEEELYYREHMRKDVNSWNKEEAPEWAR